MNKSILNTITFYIEDDNNKEVTFNQETLTFTLQMIKILNKYVYIHLYLCECLYLRIHTFIFICVINEF